MAKVGAPVSSLYGAPCGKSILKGSLGVRISKDLAFTDIPESFNPPFERKAARLQASALTKLSYDRNIYHNDANHHHDGEIVTETDKIATLIPKNVIPPYRLDTMW
jgi:hypothetical protein